MAFVHKSVLFHETIDALNIRPDGIYVDGTAGGGGHSGAILERLTTGTLISIDQDPDAIAFVSDKFRGNSCSIVRQGQFSQMTEIVNSCGFTAVDGVLMDIGVSSYQLDTPERGFSYHHEACKNCTYKKIRCRKHIKIFLLCWESLQQEWCW